MMEKCCKKCGETKLVEEFPKGRKECLVCRSNFLQEYRLKNKDKAKEYNLNWHKINIDKIREYRAVYGTKNKEKIKTAAKKYYEENRSKKISDARKWAKSNPDRRRQLSRSWDKNNRNKCNARSAKRRASKVQRTVCWANEFLINEIYTLAKIKTEITGVVHHVDHIVPLTSKSVSGLHCEANLRIISASENISKSNKWWPDMWPKENN